MKNKFVIVCLIIPIGHIRPSLPPLHLGVTNDPLIFSLSYNSKNISFLYYYILNYNVFCVLFQYHSNIIFEEHGDMKTLGFA